MLDYIKADFERYYATHRKKPNFSLKILIFFHNPELWFLISYRIGRYFYTSKNLLLKFIGLIYSVFHFYLGFFIFDIIMSLNVIANKGLYLHHRGIVIADNTKIGKNSSILGQTTIGRKFGSDSSPIIGDNVSIGVGARIIGRIKIGNNVIIGANAVVTKDIPNNMVAIGIPAKYKLKKRNKTK